MIIADEIWPNFLLEAKIYEENQEIYFSPTENGSYKITSTLNDIIRVTRLNVGSSETISIRKFTTAISRINEAGNIIPKGSIYEHVAEEVTLVELIPFFDWDEAGRNILVNGTINNLEQYNETAEAQNDDPENRVQISVRQRKGQKKFREKLLIEYGGKCTISRCSVKEVLHACHINAHSKSGINLSTNGLILRSDLHDLFDQNLIAIEPINLTIKVSSKLENTDYFNFNNTALNSRKDEKRPSIEALNRRWGKFIS